MHRRLFLTGLAVTACKPVGGDMARREALDLKRLNEEVGALALKARPGVLGAAVMDLGSAQFWGLNPDRPFPMQSVFKLPLGAAALAEADAGRLNLAETVTLTDKDLSPPLSPIADAFPMAAAYTWGDLLARAVGASDNTAADVLMKRVGGPGAVQAWLDLKGIKGVRVDRYERELPMDMYGMASFRAAWKGDMFTEVRRAVPPQTRRAATARYLADPRDTATPRGMIGFLDALSAGRLISQASRDRLLAIMTASTTGPGRLRAGLPDGAALAHKTGTAATDLGLTPATNDVGIVTLKGGQKLTIAVFLGASTADQTAREGVIAEVMRAVARAVK